MRILSPSTRFNLSDSFFCESIVEMASKLGRSVFVGLCGAQGSGKSTTAARLAFKLSSGGYRVAVCSLDDFYLTRAERLDLAAHIHPLLATRGVPGTHDVTLLQDTLEALFKATNGTETVLPTFDKASDDRRPENEWPCHGGAADVVLLEGWCIGARPQSEVALDQPINELERLEDEHGAWRGFVNDRLADDYAGIFERLDLKLMLRAPSFASVHGWRAEQERGLKRDALGARTPMDKAALDRFISHYERLTRWLLEDEPGDLIAELDERRTPFAWRIGIDRS